MCKYEQYFKSTIITFAVVYTFMLTLCNKYECSNENNNGKWLALCLFLFHCYQSIANSHFKMWPYFGGKMWGSDCI